MSEEEWYTEELLPPQKLADVAVKSLLLYEGDETLLRTEKALDFDALAAAPDKAAYMRSFVERNARGILRMHKPRWRQLTPEEVAGLPVETGDLRAGGREPGLLYLVRLGMELDVPPEVKSAGWHFKDAWCRVFLFTPGSNTQPRVLDIYPKRLYEGSPAAVKVGLGLGLSAGPLEAKVAEVSTDLHVGQVTPITLGFFGDEERAPYWELRSKGVPILGVYHFWLIVERPQGCRQVRLAVLGEGNLRSRLFVIPVGPQIRTMSDRKTVTIPDGVFIDPGTPGLPTG